MQVTLSVAVEQKDAMWVAAIVSTLQAHVERVDAIVVHVVLTNDVMLLVGMA